MRPHPRPLAVTAAIALTAAALTATPVSAAATTDSSAFRNSVTLQGITQHLTGLQAAAKSSRGNRASGTPGYEASAKYVEGRLRAAGYTPTRQAFDFDFFQERAPGTFSRVKPTPATYTVGDDFAVMDYSASTGGRSLTAPLKAVADNQIPPGATAGSSSAGCEAADFVGSFAGTIALIQRGTCTFADKVANAAAAGAVGAIIFNEGQEPDRTGVVLGTLGAPAKIPALGTTYAIGAELAGLVARGLVEVSLSTDTVSETRRTFNIIADTTTGRADRTVVVGAHLDSVAEGAGINDNGSGSATILEIAEELAKVGTTNRVRFGFWGAEESGLLGAAHYVSQLQPSEVKDIAVNLNFDMMGSPNFGRFIYDGDGSATGASGPTGSGNVESVFTDYFASQGLYAEPTAFDGRSDYGPFIDAGIPAGGLFSGAEDAKTVAQAAPGNFGGQAGVAFDACYHQACDTTANINNVGLDQMADGAAHAVLTFAQTTSAVNGTSQASTGTASGLADAKGPALVR